MNGEALIRLIEEMIDLKVQQHIEPNVKSSPQVTQLLQQKRITDGRRLQQIRAELLRLLQN